MNDLRDTSPATTVRRPIEEALSQLGFAIVRMADLTDAESEALESALEPVQPEAVIGDPPEPASKLAAQIARLARRVEECNAYRSARLARIDLPRG